METLEQKIPSGEISISSEKGYVEKQFLSSYMNVNPESVYDCGTCNNCGSGNCNDCCGSTDDD